ncbi:hypothetical protein D770_04910 [Flammeovirgaceae bacterium 311]|nr:hypothetical protein D770_04910 [Flammeovirgaceae bacterium 311]
MKTKLLKTLLLATLILNAASGYGQELKKQLSSDVCSCFTQAKGSSTLDFDTFQNCFGQSLIKYKDDIEKLIDINSDIPEHEQGYRLGNQIYTEVQSDLIHNCDPFFSLIEEMREASITSMRQQTSQQMIDSLSTLIAKHQTIDLLWQRGTKYFAFQDLEKAEMDLRECIRLDPNYIQADFFLAWVLERKGEFLKARELYEKVYSVTNKQEILLAIDILKRKHKH